MSLLFRGLLVSLLLVAAAPASGAAPSSVFLEDLTWTELRDAIRAGKTTVIVPVGGTEQSGPCIALGKHNARVRVLAQRIAETLGNALVAPVIAYVPEGNLTPPTSHMRFPGTITVPHGAFVATLESAAQSFKIHGFRDIVFLGDHGGYQNDLRRAAARLNAAWVGSGAKAFVPLEYYEASTGGFARLLRARGLRSTDRDPYALLIRAPDGHLFPLRRVARIRAVSGQPQIGVYNWAALVAVTNPAKQINQRIDQMIGSKQRLFGRFGYMGYGGEYTNMPLGLYSAPIGGDEKVTLNFVDADIATVVKALGLFTQRNFVLDGRVKGKINLVSPRALTRDEAYATLLSALRLQGFTVVEAGGVAKVVPEADAKLHGAPASAGEPAGRGDRVVTRVFKLRMESASNLLPVLRPIAGT